VLSEFKVKLPRFQEQEKIGDCLSCVGELISAQTQKLNALKGHKKGLMQQLFPSADEVTG
jgi:type I restriction enzyme S subunit